MVEIYFFALNLLLLALKLGGWEEKQILNLFIQKCFLHNLMFQVHIVQSWINVVASNLISKYILQSHIDVIYL
jgi:hypothetical protein